MIWQLILNGVVAASAHALLGLGFGLIFWVTRFFHFAHGIVFVAGAYLAFLFRVWLGLPLFVAFVFSTGLCVILGCCMDLSVYRPLRRKRASSLILLLASLGIYIVLQNLVSIVFGDDTKSIRSGAVEEGLNILGARITPIQVLTVCLSLASMAAVFALLRRTKIGSAMRAVACDSELACVSGIESNRVALWTFAVGSGIAGMAGILIALDMDMTPTMGLIPLMMGVVAVIIGGQGSIPGLALGALFVGLAQHLGIWRISSQWQDAIAFVILLAFLFFRPQGFLGKKLQTTTV